MKISVKKPGYEARFRTFIKQIMSLSRLKPKERYLYKIMDGVPFQDLETAIQIAKIDHEEQAAQAGNDNANG